MTITLKHVFKHVFVDGLENYRNDKPVVLACNHPNSFLDGIMFDVVLPKPLYILTRGDSMNSKFKRSIFSKLNIVPIHRLSEGKENLIKNDETFIKCREILKDKGTVIIFSEGLCVQEKRMRPLKKGTARICLEFIKNYPEMDLHVIPTGINVDEFNTPKSNINLNIGKSLDLTSVSKTYIENPAKGILEFNALLAPKIKERIIHLDTVENEMLFNQTYLPQFRTNFLNTFIFNTSLINDKIEVANQLNQGISPVVNSQYQVDFRKHYLFFGLVKSLLFIFKIFFFLPNSLTNYIVNNKVSNPVFKHSVFVGLKMILGTLNCLILIIIALLAFGWEWAILSILVIYILLQITPYMHNYLLNYSTFKKGKNKYSI